MLAALTLALLASAPPAAEFPGAQPQLAVAGRRVGLVFGEDRSILFAGSRDGGRTFSAPVLVPSQGRLALGRRRGPASTPPFPGTPGPPGRKTGSLTSLPQERSASAVIPRSPCRPGGRSRSCSATRSRAPATCT